MAVFTVLCVVCAMAGSKRLPCPPALPGVIAEFNAYCRSHHKPQTCEC